MFYLLMLLGDVWCCWPPAEPEGVSPDISIIITHGRVEELLSIHCIQCVLFGIMMQYSNWLIGVKNRAHIRQTCQTPDIEWRSRSSVNNNHPQQRKISSVSLSNHLWKNGEMRKIFNFKHMTVLDIAFIHQNKYAVANLVWTFLFN